MLDLYKLCNKFAAISPLQPVIYPAGTEEPNNLCTFYTKQLNPADGQASYLITDEFLFFGKIHQKNTGNHILIGPASEHYVTLEVQKRIAAAMGMRGRQAEELAEELAVIPLLSVTDFLQYLSFLNYIINESETVLSNFSAYQRPHEQKRKRSSTIPDHNTANLENEMLGYVEFGRIDLMEQLFRSSKINQSTTSILSDDSLRTHKNLFISSATLAARAAIRGGLGYDLSLSITDDYLYRIEKVQTISAVQQMLQEMMLDFASRTAQLQLREDNSPLIKNTVRLISERRHQKISVEELAQEQNVSRSYLSHQFKREMGENLTDYIAKHKINEAIRLMNITELNLAEIAYQLGFSSQSYFHATFKKVTGVNPGKYPRNKF